MATALKRTVCLSLPHLLEDRLRSARVKGRELKVSGTCSRIARLVGEHQALAFAFSVIGMVMSVGHAALPRWASIGRHRITSLTCLNPEQIFLRRELRWIRGGRTFPPKAVSSSLCYLDHLRDRSLTAQRRGTAVQFVA